VGGTGTILDPNQQAQFINQIPSQLDIPGQRQAQTTTPAADLGGTEDLESRRSQNVDVTGHLLHVTNQQNLALQGQVEQQQQQLQDPFQKIAGSLADRYQALQQEQRATGIKRVLKNFFGGMGAAMLHDASLLSPEDQQANLLQQLVTVKNAQAIDGLRQVQAQNQQLVTREMPDGSQIQIPLEHVGTYDAAMARQQLVNQKPGDLNDQIGRSVYSAIQQGRDPNQDPTIKQLLEIQRGMQKPPADTSAQQKSDFMTGIQPMIQAGEFTPDMQTDARKLVAGIQRSRAIPAAQKPALISYLTASTTPASQGTQAQIKVSLDNTAKTLPVYDTQNKNSLVYLSPEAINAGNAAQPGRYTQAGQIRGGEKTGYAYDPKSNQTVLTNPEESAQNGYTAFRPVTEANIRNDTHDTTILNDVALKANNLIASAEAVNDSGQRNLIARVIDAADRDDQYRVGAFGTSIPTQWFNNLINSENAGALNQQGRNYLVSLLSLRESSMGMQRLLTGTARSNESQIKALQATLPGAEPDANLVRQKMGAFTQNIDMLRQGIPKLPGIDVIPISRTETQGKEWKPPAGDFFSQFGGQARQ
jgi:hypothetical protein